jgi:hypothetical protein
MHYEHKSQALLPLEVFLRRVLIHFGIALAVIGGSLLAGMYGYHELGRMTWVDSFLNAAMILGGMGPIGDLPTDTAKIFAGIYALYAGLVFVVTAGIVVTPIAHRILHRMHLEE